MRDRQVIERQPDQIILTDRYVQEAVSFLRENRARPFFLYFSHLYVHLPIYVPEPYLQNSRNGRYGAAVDHVDWSIAVLLRELREFGLDERTLVIFTSDNGSRVNNEGSSNGPLRGTKGTTWEGGLRVPCIARWTGVIEPGQVGRELITAMDVLPPHSSNWPAASSTRAGPLMAEVGQDVSTDMVHLDEDRHGRDLIKIEPLLTPFSRRDTLAVCGTLPSAISNASALGSRGSASGARTRSTMSRAYASRMFAGCECQPGLLPQPIGSLPTCPAHGDLLGPFRQEMRRASHLVGAPLATCRGLRQAKALQFGCGGSPPWECRKARTATLIVAGVHRRHSVQRFAF